MDKRKILEFGIGRIDLRTWFWKYVLGVRTVLSGTNVVQFGFG